MNGKNLKRAARALRGRQSLKSWARSQIAENGDFAGACRTWLARKGTLLLLALLAFPMLGAPEGCNQQPVPFEEVEDALPKIPWRGCDEPRILAPGPEENGNWISLRRGHADRFVSTIWIDHRNWMIGAPPRTIASCAPHELVITVFRAGNLVSPAETIVITNPAWNLLEVPITRLSGEIWVNVEFRYEVATATHTCLGVCGDTQVTQRGDFFWCRPEPGSSLPNCYDMVDGGATPQPGFVAYAPMIWTDACYSSRTC